MSINRDQNEMGLSFLGKSKDLYTNLLELPECKTENGNHPKTLVNLSQYFSNSETQRFVYMYEGGVCLSKTESLYTHTLFYLAQAYTKLGQSELAA